MEQEGSESLDRRARACLPQILLCVLDGTYVLIE